MRRFFSKCAEKIIEKSPIEETIQDQFKKISRNPKFSNIIKKMQIDSKKIKLHDNEHRPVPVEKITELLDIEKENAKFSIY